MVKKLFDRFDFPGEGFFEDVRLIRENLLPSLLVLLIIVAIFAPFIIFFFL